MGNSVVNLTSAVAMKVSKVMLILLGLTPVLVPADQVPEYPAVAPKYDYTWQVADDYAKVNYGQKETRDGATTAGSYFVLLPDGRTQKVAYTVDAYGGYKATVTYEGAAKPYVPTYKAQASSYKPVKTYRPAPKATEKKDTAKPYYKVKPTPKAEAKKDISKPGEVYYKPVKNTPKPKVYYKPVENAKPAKVYYKPIDA